LQENQIKGARPVFNEMHSKEMVTKCYDNLVNGTDFDYDLGPYTEEMIEQLLENKDLNEAQFFSKAFKVGVYLPLLAPLLTVLKFLLAYLKGSRLAKDNKLESKKQQPEQQKPKPEKEVKTPSKEAKKEEAPKSKEDLTTTQKNHDKR
jgi:hypothetical protein